MKFTKMHGIGNDYVYVNGFEETIADPAAAARYVSDRHFGIGSDGLIIIRPSDIADCEMDMYNLDGSQGAMCGNGIRCVGKYVYDHGIVRKNPITVATRSGIRTLEFQFEGNQVKTVRVAMGSPVLRACEIPVICGLETAVHVPISAAGKTWYYTGVSMGNPHAVIFTEDVASLDLQKIGPEFEMHPDFPDRINTEFVQVLDEHTIQMRVWERGSGETLACGTGACAAAVASILNHQTADAPITVKLPGGDLLIEWNHAENMIYMTGEAVTVFDGEIQLPEQ